MTDPVKVEQIDRDAAAALMRSMPLGGLVGSVDVVEGNNDAHPFVQAFARHRLASPSREPGDDARETIIACINDHIETEYVGHWIGGQEAAADATIAALTLPEQPRPVDDVMRERLANAMHALEYWEREAEYAGKSPKWADLPRERGKFEIGQIRSALGQKDGGGE